MYGGTGDSRVAGTKQGGAAIEMEELLKKIPKPIVILLLMLVASACWYMATESRADTLERITVLEARDFEISKQVHEELSDMRKWLRDEFKDLKRNDHTHEKSTGKLVFKKNQ